MYYPVCLRCLSDLSSVTLINQVMQRYDVMAKASCQHVRGWHVLSTNGNTKSFVAYPFIDHQIDRARQKLSAVQNPPIQATSAPDPYWETEISPRLPERWDRIIWPVGTISLVMLGLLLRPMTNASPDFPGAGGSSVILVPSLPSVYIPLRGEKWLGHDSWAYSFHPKQQNAQIILGK